MYSYVHTDTQINCHMHTQITSPPSEPDTITKGGVVFKQLKDIELVIVVLQVGLVEHGVPKLTTFTEYMCLKTKKVSTCLRVSKVRWQNL